MTCELVIDARMIEHSGIGSYLQNLLPYLSRAFTVTVLGDCRKIRQFPWGQQVKCISMSSPIYSLAEQVELPLRIPQAQFFWSPHFNVPVMPVRAKTRLVTIHDLFHLAFAHWYNPLERITAATLIRAAVNLSRIIFTVSRFTRQELMERLGVHPDRIVVVPNGVNHDVFYPWTDSQRLLQIREKYGLPENFFLYVGNVKPHKNLKRCLEALKILHEKGLDLFFVVVGQSEGLRKRDRQVWEMSQQDSLLREKVRWLGTVPLADLPGIYQCARLLVFPSLYEGFGLPPLEAMACGCPVVASMAASLPEVCGDAVVYVDPTSVEDLAKGIEMVWTDATLRQELREKGLEQSRRFRWENTANQLIHVIQNLCETG